MSGVDKIFTGDFLAKIRKLTESRVAEAKRIQTSAELREILKDARATFDLGATLRRGNGPRIIAEIKRQSPSRGAIALDLDPLKVAGEYLEAGATAISVLTEPTHFGGNLETLRRIRAAYPQSVLLMKDFVIDSYQLLQAREAGADAVLLMVSLLGERVDELYDEAVELGLTPLVEVHDARELLMARRARVIGVNNRNLRTLSVSLQVSRLLARHKPIGSLFVSESGIETRAHIDELSPLGFDAFLIGSSLMQHQTPGASLANLRTVSS